MTLVRESALEGHVDEVWGLAWSPSGDMLASSGTDKTIRMWARGADGQWRCEAILDDCARRTIRNVAWSPCGRYVAAVSFDGTTSVWERRGTDFEMLATLEGHENEVKGVAFSPSGQYIATCGRDKSAFVWEADPAEDFECVTVLQGHTQDVKSVAWHPAEDTLVTVSYDDTIRLWEAVDDDWVCTQTLTGHSSTVWGASFSPSGDFLASCGDDQQVLLWRRERRASMPSSSSGAGQFQWKRACTVAGYHEDTIFSIDWARHGPWVATGSRDDTIRLFSVAGGNGEGGVGEVTCLPAAAVEHAHSGDVNCVRWHPRERLLVSAGDDGLVCLWRWQPEDDEPMQD